MPKPNSPIIVVVDTNCFIRLLFSPLRPVLGATFSGHKLMTLIRLADECGPGTAVAERNPWLLEASVQKELIASCIKLRQPKTSQVDESAKYFRKEGNSLLRNYCNTQGIQTVRELSITDSHALATAQVLKFKLATDEWPLTLVAKRASDVTEVMTSLDIIHLMELDGKVSKAQRTEVVTRWLMHDERLPNNWRDHYIELFKEEPPTSQS